MVDGRNIGGGDFIAGFQIRCLSKTRDNRRFPGTAEKTLQGQGLESVSVEGTVGGEEVDPLLWPGVRPPEVGPR